MNILHLTFHKGTGLEIEYTFTKLGHKVTTIRFDDGETSGNDIYIVTHIRAQKAWDKYKDYYNSFDAIITSDTCPISRTFLQNNWNKLLIIWICNRFDYAMLPENEDPEFYNLLRDIPNRKNVFIIGNTSIENVYAKFIKNVDIGELVIQPIGKNLTLSTQTKNYTINDTKLFYVPPYHNETIMMNLSEKLTSLGIMNECKRFDSILYYSGVISIPYAWSTIALFERIQLGIINFIPSIPFLLELFRSYGNFWVQPPFDIHTPDILSLFSEFYIEENKCYFVYFDSWEHLKYQIDTLDYTAKTKEILEFAKKHEDKNMNLWKSVIEKYNKNSKQI
jgi:hypothetical protein